MGDRWPTGLELFACEYGCGDPAPVAAAIPPLLLIGGAATIGGCTLPSAVNDEPAVPSRAGRLGSDSPCSSVVIGTDALTRGAVTFGTVAPWVKPPAVFARLRPAAVGTFVEVTGAVFALPVFVTVLWPLDFVDVETAAPDVAPLVAEPDAEPVSG